MKKLKLAPGGLNNNTLDVESHPRKHLSDFVAEYILQRYGAKRYGREAPIPGRRTVLVGRGGYDEHGDSKLRECEATLVVSDLGVRDLPELKPLLDYTLQVDRFGGGKGVLKFGRLVELMHDVLPPHRVAHWARVMIEALIEGETDKTSVEPERVFKFIMAAYAKVKNEFPPETRVELDKLLDGFSPRAAFEPFGIFYCASVLWKKFRRLPHKPTPTEWIADAFRAELTRQKLFLDAEAEAKKAQRATVVIRGVEAEIALVRSDGQRIHSAVFSEYKKVVAVIARRSTGHVQIFRRIHRAPVRVKLQDAAAFLRACEQQKAGEPISRLEELAAQQGPEGIGKRWFFHHATQNILNGALSAPDVEPTALADHEIVERLFDGLDDSSREIRSRFYREKK